MKTRKKYFLTSELSVCLFFKKKTESFYYIINEWLLTSQWGINVEEDKRVWLRWCALGYRIWKTMETTKKKKLETKKKEEKKITARIFFMCTSSSP
jgi:hypothetical protein